MNLGNRVRAQLLSVLFDPLRDFLLRHRARMSCGDFALLEDHEGRQATNTVFRGGHRIVVYIDLGDFNVAA